MRFVAPIDPVDPEDSLGNVAIGALGAGATGDVRELRSVLQRMRVQEERLQEERQQNFLNDTEASRRTLLAAVAWEGIDYRFEDEVYDVGDGILESIMDDWAPRVAADALLEGNNRAASGASDADERGRRGDTADSSCGSSPRSGR